MNLNNRKNYEQKFWLFKRFNSYTNTLQLIYNGWSDILRIWYSTVDLNKYYFANNKLIDRSRYNQWNNREPAQLIAQKTVSDAFWTQKYLTASLTVSESQNCRSFDLLYPPKLCGTRILLYLRKLEKLIAINLWHMNQYSKLS